VPLLSGRIGTARRAHAYAIASNSLGGRSESSAMASEAATAGMVGQPGTTGAAGAPPTVVGWPSVTGDVSGMWPAAGEVVGCAGPPGGRPGFSKVPGRTEDLGTAVCGCLGTE
jgi:hypothetical protein